MVYNCCRTCSNLAKALLFPVFFVAVTLCIVPLVQVTWALMQDTLRSMVSSSEVEMQVLKR